MRILKFLFLFLIFSTLSFADSKYTVVTGFGYLTDSNSHIIVKAEYPVGSSVEIPTGLTYTEVANQVALDAITIYVAPVPPTQSFNLGLFLQQLAGTSLITDVNVLPYYAVMKDLIAFQNFQQLANLVGGLLQGGVLNQAEVDTLDSTFENQDINLDSYNSEVNVAY